jgi:hypothetical protein
MADRNRRIPLEQADLNRHFAGALHQQNNIPSQLLITLISYCHED